MARLTKNSYKRKIILFGVLVFMSIALVSTGFAAWVMSTNASNDDITGNVAVGTVKDASLTISDVIIKSDAKSFKFEPQDSDNSGRVRFDSSATEAESLKITIEGKISPIEYLGKLNYELVIPESVKKAADAGYIVLPDCASIAQGTAGVEYTFTPGTGELTFTFDIEFKWGSVFGNMNPGRYYDEDATGLLVADDVVKTTLEDFRAVLYGYDAELVGLDAAARAAKIAEHEVDAGPQFVVFITATSN